jgi:mannose-6-phosphate isomerase-like protein (cupin superfamily)
MEYTIRTDVKFGPLTLIDAGALADACTEPWWNQTLCRVNDSAVRLGVFQGEFHWHKHDREDELFYVVEGVLLVDLRDRTAALQPRQGILVPRGVEHRTRAQERTVVLMVEAATVVPIGDIGPLTTEEN